MHQRALALLYFMFGYAMALSMAFESPMYLKFGSVMLFCYLTFQLIDKDYNEDN